MPSRHWLVFIAINTILLVDSPSIYGQQEAIRKHWTQSDGSFESGWVLQIPAGSSDFFSVRFDATAEQDGSDVTGLSISVADFGSSSTFPVAGHYRSNLGLDPLSNTPDLSVPFAEVFSPSVLGGPLFDCQSVPFNEADRFALATGDTLHAVVQIPPGNPGSLNIGADDDPDALGGDEPPGLPNLFDASFFSNNGYATPSSFIFAAELGINIELDETPRLINQGTTRLSLGVNANDFTGDFDFVSVGAGRDLGIGFWSPLDGPQAPLWILFFSVSGVPVQRLTIPLPSLPVDTNDDGQNDLGHLRLAFGWPCGFGGLSFTLVAVSGTPGVVGSVRVSNEVTLTSLDDVASDFGQRDDGSYESGWVVQVPSGSQDFFNVRFGADPNAPILNGFALAVQDSGTTNPTFSRVGLAPSNLSVDPSGNTPDLIAPYAETVFPFPPLTFVTTASEMVAMDLGANISTTDEVHGFIQFPPGDPGLLAIGADTQGSSMAFSGLSDDGFATPSLGQPLNWGIRASGCVRY